MLSKSTAYKVLWAGRYLERIENIARVGLFLKDEEGVKAVFAVSDVREYLKSQFNLMREDMRSFADENVIASLSYLERAVLSDATGEKYYRDVLESVLSVGNAVEGMMAPHSKFMLPKKQEEVREESRNV